SDEVAKGAAIGVGGYPLAEDLQNGGFELTASFHEGRINAIRVGRTDLTGERMTFFEFDARVNAGNSGGPLFLRDTGEVVGVVVAKLGADTGIGFAIPINVVLDVWRNPPFEAQRREVHSAAAFIGRGGLYRDTSAGFELRVPEGFKSIAPRDGLTAQFDAVQGECLLFVKSCFAAQPLSQCARLLESTLGVRATQTRVADLDGRPGLEVRYQRGDVAGKARMCVEKGRFYALGYVSPAAEARAWEEAFEEALDQFLVLGPEPQAGGAHQYVNEEFRFRVRAPEGWRMERPDEPALRVGVVSPDGRCTVAFGAERLQEEMTPEGYAEAVEGDFCGTLTENGLMQLGRHRAVQRVYRHTDADGQWRLRVVAATRKRTGYLAVACAREPDFRKHQEEIDGIIRSFELFPATESATPGGAPRFEVVRVVASATSTIQDGQRSTFAPDVEAVYCVFDYAGAKPNTHVAVRWYFKGKCQRRLSRNLVLQSGEGRAAFALRRGEDELFP
ncbi:MAG: trypsin-like peptidase domain-containing protein, partial [Armatimonadota bacterium]